MNDATGTTKKHWRDIVNLVLGVWLFISPWVLAGAPVHTFTWNLYLMGAIIALVAILALVVFDEWEEWVGLVAALWLLASPWAMGFEPAGALVWSSLAVALVVGIMALWSLADIHSKGAHDKGAHA